LLYLNIYNATQYSSKDTKEEEEEELIIMKNSTSDP
jgi:hypothetical protein